MLTVPEPTDPAPLPRSLYVYYRVPVLVQVEAKAAIEAMQMALRESVVGLAANLMQRVDIPKHGAEVTWMEIYAHPNGISPSHEALLADHLARLPCGLIGERHVEVFAPLI